MYLSFFDIVVCILKSAFFTSLFVGQMFLTHFFYNIGCAYCNMIGVPNDFALTVMSPGMAIEVAIVLTVLEFALIYWIVNKLKMVKFIRKFSDKICELM